MCSLCPCNSQEYMSPKPNDQTMKCLQLHSLQVFLSYLYSIFKFLSLRPRRAPRGCAVVRGRTGVYSQNDKLSRLQQTQILLVFYKYFVLSLHKKRLCLLSKYRKKKLDHVSYSIRFFEDVGGKEDAFDVVSDGVQVLSTVRFTGAAETNVNFRDVYYYEYVALLVFGKVYGDLHEVAET